MGNKGTKIKEHTSNYNNEFKQPENDDNYWKTTTRTSNVNSQTSTNVTFPGFQGTNISLNESINEKNRSKESLIGCGSAKLTEEESLTSLKVTEDKPKIVAAIDFGTTFTGFAYSYGTDRSSIETGNRELGGDRVPTVVLLNPDSTINSVGRKAQYEYAQLLLMNKHNGYRLFSRFKMALYTKGDLKHDTTIRDNDDKTMPALELFTIVIRYMAERATEMIKDSLSGDKNNIKDTILWILTIPAIWSDSARQFMHEVFVNAGISEKQFRLVLEPEAAAIYCRNDLLHRSDDYEIGKLPVGTKYILADLGGGTVDICSHEILKNNRIREIFRAPGGAFGGTCVDDQFIESLIEIFGSDVFRKFQQKHFYDYLELIEAFENRKRLFFGQDSEARNEIVITVPCPLLCLFQETADCCLEDKVRKGPYSENVNFHGGKLYVKREQMEKFFSKSVQGIISCLQKIVHQCKGEDIKSILLVGGYAESKYVTDKIKSEMKTFGREVIVVSEPRLSVMKGAVMLGYEDRKIVQRKSRVTYGFEIAEHFIEGKHLKKYKCERDGKYLCSKIFQKLIEKDQYVEYGQEFKTTTLTSRKHPKTKTEKVIIPVFISEQCNPIYCSEEEECRQVGEIIIEPPEGGWPDEEEKELYLIVQEDIMLCKVIDKNCGGKEYTTKDYISVRRKD